VIGLALAVKVAVFVLVVAQVNAAGHDDVEYPAFGLHTGVTVVPSVHVAGVTVPLPAGVIV